MKITIHTDDGVVITTINAAEQFDLATPFARAALCEELASAIRRGRHLEAATPLQPTGTTSCRV